MTFNPLSFYLILYRFLQQIALNWLMHTYVVVDKNQHNQRLGNYTYTVAGITSRKKEGGAITRGLVCSVANTCVECGPQHVLYIVFDIGSCTTSCKNSPIQFAFISNFQ